MDDTDHTNLIVLMIFAVCMIALIAGYFLAWRSKRTVYRKTGALLAAAVTGFGGLVMLWWLMGAIMPLPSPDGSPLWEPLIAVLVLSPLPLGAFYMSVRFIRQAYGDQQKF
ncbi:MAG TPA: hypothetical protein VJN89_18855 [Candidatus Acidoferrum sp.]|nr:hypothetical protein [Candidatus Acidoferrum sp.]